MKNALVILSGGQDSTTCLYWAKQTFYDIHAVTFDYGQRHKREIEAARWIAEMAEVKSHEVIKIPDILKGTSPLVSDKEPEQYENWQSLPGGLEDTFVPCRNILFLTIAANRAYAHGVTDIVTGVAQEDFGGYPDCRENFIFQMQRALIEGLTLSTTEPMRNLIIHTPLMHMSKADTVRLAQNLEGCMAALAHSHTGYDNAYPPTGKDHATLLRAKGFEQAGVPDPLVVRAVNEGLMPYPMTENYFELRLARDQKISQDALYE